MLEIRSPAYLNEVLILFNNRSTNNKNDRKFLNDILTIVRNNIEFIDEKNVIPIANLLKNHAFNFVYNHNPDSEIFEKVQHIRDSILKFTSSENMGHIHYFILDKDFKGVRALVRLGLGQLSKPGGSPGRTALQYAKELNQRGNCDSLVRYLEMFQGQPEFENLNNIICDKGNPPEGFEHAEELLLSMHSLGLQILQSYSYGVTYHFTNTFKMEERSVFGDRPLIFAWVELEGKFYPRLFWLSQSQGVWRRVDKCFRNWIGKSVRGEAGIAVPIYVNFEMYKVHQSTLTSKQFKALPTDKGEHFLRYIVAWSNNSVQLYTKRTLERRLVLPILREGVSDQQEMSEYTEAGADSLWDESENKGIELGQNYLPPNPRDNTFTLVEHWPNFSQVEATETLYHPLYKELMARVILSANGEYRYLFLEKNIKGQRFAFLAAVEKAEKNTVTKLGLHTKWVDPRSLALPLYEYPKQFKVNNQFLPTK